MTAEEIIRSIGGTPRDQNLALMDLLPPSERGKAFLMHMRRKGVSANGDDEDLLQEVVIKIFRNAAGFNGNEQFGDASANQWMWSIVRNCINDYLKSKERPDQRRARELSEEHKKSARDAAMEAGFEREGKKLYPYVPPTMDTHRQRDGSLDDPEWRDANVDALGGALQGNSEYQSGRLAEIEREKCVQSGLDDFASDYADRAKALYMQIDGESIESIARRMGRTVNAAKTFISQSKKKLKPYIEHCRAIGQVD